MNKYAEIYFNSLQKAAEEDAYKVRDPRELTPEEIQNIKNEKSKILPRWFVSNDDDASHLIKNPTRGALMGALGGGITLGSLGGVLGANGDILNNSTSLPLSKFLGVGGFLGGGILGSILSRRAVETSNKNIEGAIKRTRPGHTTVYDTEMDPVLRNQRNRAVMMM